MKAKHVVIAGVAAMCLFCLRIPNVTRAQGKTSAKALRCTFQLNATGNWKGAAPDAVLKPSTLLLRFDAINTDEGTAELRNGSVASEITAQFSGGNLHFIQTFRAGGLYVTTVFGKESRPGWLKAVHSRHEYFSVPLEGATSSPEQYYGECEILN